jgi:hypothetical protein
MGTDEQPPSDDHVMTRFAVDIPARDGHAMGEIGTYDTREEAITVARDLFGADEEGRISLVSEFDEEHVSDTDAR